MSFQELAEILNKPLNPIETVDANQWEFFELVTGIFLPDDYKEYLGFYGTGIIGGVITPYNPFCKRQLWKARYTCRDWMRELCAIIEHKQQFGKAVFPYPVYPDPGGVLPWGSTDNGDRLFWLTTNSPNDWKVLMNESRSSSFEVFEHSMTGFIKGLITGEIESEIIPYDSIDRDNLFEGG